MKQSDWLKDIAIYLEGVKAGRGDLLPLGNEHLNQLWIVLKELQSLEAYADLKKKRK